MQDRHSVWLRVLWGLSHDRPKTPTWESDKNRVRLGGFGTYGTPYGYARAILLYLVIRAIQSNRVIQISRAGVSGWLGVDEHSTLSSRLGEHLRRVVECCYQVVEFAYADGVCILSNLDLFESRRDCGETGPVTLTLTEAFYQDICNGPRFALDVIKTLILGNQLQALDLYLWYQWQLHEGAARCIDILGPDSPFHLIQMSQCAHTWRDRLHHLHEIIVAVWPECPFSISEDRRCILYTPDKEKRTTGPSSTPGSGSPARDLETPDRTDPPRTGRLTRLAQTAVRKARSFTIRRVVRPGGNRGPPE